MNEHYDPSFLEALDRARELGWRPWLTVAAMVAVAGVVLWLADPWLCVGAAVFFGALLGLASPDARAVFRAVWLAVWVAAALWAIVAALAAKGAS